MDTQDANTVDEDEFYRREGPGGEAELDPQEGPDDTFEVELDGKVHALPAALKGAFLRQADYTRKTQELAEHRRALEADRQAVAQHAQATNGASGDRIRLAALDHQLESFRGVDWQAYAAQDPHAAQALWGRFQGMAQARDQLAYAISHHAQRSQLQAAREAAARMAETGQTLQREIEGWSPEVAAKLVEYAQAFGVTLDELREAADPRVWKILHRAYQAEQTGQKDGASRAAAQAQAVRPAVLVSGGAAGGGGGVRDELGTKEWMQRRNDQTRKAR
ncbi:hypothetical protein [Phenylobacterium hankyongense]|nr:hypothetical protein [Phenylobacterium hankyongense]